MDIDEIIKDKKIKLTKARISLLDILRNAKKPLSYEDIKADISMDKATFYRNIAKFEEQGILSSFESNDKKRYFELYLIPHAHFVCIKCSKIECLNDVYLQFDGYEINNVIVNGKCKECVASNE